MWFFSFILLMWSIMLFKYIFLTFLSPEIPITQGLSFFFILSTALDALVWTSSTFPFFIFQVWAIYIDLSSSIRIPNLWGLQVCNKPVTGIQHLLLRFSFLRFPLDSNSVHLYWKSFSIHACCPSIPLQPLNYYS